MKLHNITELELYFANRFDTILFPILADLYYQKGDLRRSRKVCEIGLKHHPLQEDGLFVLAKVVRDMGDLKAAEKHLKTLLRSRKPYLQAAIMLVEIQMELGRAQSTVVNAWKKVLALDPDHGIARQALNIPTSTNVFPDKESALSETESVPSFQKAIDLPTQEGLESLGISPKLATFTLVAVLKNQGLFYQALEVLDVLGQRGEDPERIAAERQSIHAALPTG